MVAIGTPNADNTTRVMLCGAGELGKEVAIELQRLGIEVIAVDRYAGAPAMQVAHRAYTIDMLDGDALRRVVAQERPGLIVPEIEAIATDTLAQLEQEGYGVIPTARATQLTMNRKGIRQLAAEELQVPTSAYRFADSRAALGQAAREIGFPCVVKPIMSSSGKGQSIVSGPDELDAAWHAAGANARGAGGEVIVEGYIDFDYEITLLTVRHAGGTVLCEPVGHRQVGGDYHESWQPQPMSARARSEASRIAQRVTGALGGRGVFGVELFVKADAVYFSEVSPRPHDTGMVTMISQDLSEFALHVRAILGLPIPAIRQFGPSASAVILARGDSDCIEYRHVDRALQEPDTQIRLFGKPVVRGQRRMGVALARAATIEAARARAQRAARAIEPRPV